MTPLKNYYTRDEDLLLCMPFLLLCQPIIGEQLIMSYIIGFIHNRRILHIIGVRSKNWNLCELLNFNFTKMTYIIGNIIFTKLIYPILNSEYTKNTNATYYNTINAETIIAYLTSQQTIIAQKNLSLMVETSITIICLQQQWITKPPSKQQKI